MTVWLYPRCYVVEVYDGDTVTVDIDLGQDTWVRRRAVRLDGIAALELREPGGHEARDNLRELLPVGLAVVITSTGWDKYAGRIDGRIAAPSVGLPDVGARLILDGWALPWNGRGAQPKPAWPRVAA